MAIKPYQNPNMTFFNGLLNYGFLMWALVVRGLREEAGGAAIGFLKGVLMALGFCIIFSFFLFDLFTCVHIFFCVVIVLFNNHFIIIIIIVFSSS